MADNNATQDNLQNISLGFDGVMAMIGTTAGLIPGKPAEVFAASFGVMNGTITGVISFEGSEETRMDLEKALLGTLVGALSGILIAAALTAVGAATPIIILGAGATALATGLTGDWQYDKYTVAQKTFFDWIVKNNYDLEIRDDVNSLWNAFKNWTAPRRDPLVLDLDGDGIETLAINATSNVVFDYDGDGLKTGTGWIKGDDGFVVLDRNGNGTIDNGGELFGDQTLVNGAKASDGFAALSGEDSNNDGLFDARDSSFTAVRIWQDTNSDGLSQTDELHTMSELGITSINLTSTTSNTVSNGNVQIAKGTYTKTNGTTGDSGTLGLLDEAGIAGNLNFAQMTVNNQNFKNTRRVA